MKRSELIFNVISVPVDFLLIYASVTVAYFLRYRVESLPVLFDLSYQEFMKISIVGIPFLLILFALSGLYVQKITRGFWKELGKIVTAVSAALMLVVLLFFFNKNLFPSRLIILMSWIFTIILVGLGRGILLLIQRRLLKRGAGLHRIIVVEGLNKNPVVEEIETNPNFGYELVEKFAYSDDLPARIEAIHRQNKVDELLQADGALPNSKVLTLIETCEDLGIRFNYLPTILESHLANIETDVIGSMPVIRVHNTPLEGWGRVAKRLMDIAAAFFGLIFFSPFFAVISLLIKLDSKGPVFFHQCRGSSFRNFELYKFRSMYTEMSEGTPEGDQLRAELERQNSRQGPYVKIKNDPRVTRVGRILRKTKLDELPQLWHILRGQMSLVGPRVHMVKEVEKFENSHKKVFTIKPGATGLAQINQFSNPELPFEEEIKLDLFYIENWTIWLDIYIIFKTMVVLFTKQPKEDY